VRIAAVTVGLFAIGVGAFVIGRGTAAPGGHRNPIGLVGGVAVGVSDTPAGALAAADNYVAQGITASLDEGRLERFATTAIEPGARRAFLVASRSSLEGQSLPPGSEAIGLVVAHELGSYAPDEATVTTWDVGCYWGPGLAPTQFWALTELRLRWTVGRWEIAAVEEQLPGPLPARVVVDQQAATAGGWSTGLDGMSGPYYGDR
jgi:hypothetical protein